MRWEKEKASLTIMGGIDESKAAVWIVRIVNANGDEVTNFKGLPIEFGAKVPKTDKDGLTKLKQAVSSWAIKNGYTTASV
jgi:hypothetical protein